MLLFGLSTGHMIGLSLVAGAFVVFALVASMLVPRYRPDFPGSGGLRLFIVAALLFFVGTLAAVEGFAKEEKEGPERHAAPGEVTTAAVEAGRGDVTVTGNTPATTSAGTVARTIVVKGTEFRFALSQSKLGPGSYELKLENDGKIAHNLVISGPGLSNEQTPVIEPGRTASLKVALAAGTYTLYCSVPGHEDAGMKVELEVG